MCMSPLQVRDTRGMGLVFGGMDHISLLLLITHGRPLVPAPSSLYPPHSPHSHRSMLLLLPICPPREQMRGQDPLRISAAHLPPSGGSSTCSLVNFLVAFLSISRSSSHRLRSERLWRMICARIACAARIGMHCSQVSLLIVARGRFSVVVHDAKDADGLIETDGFIQTQ